MTLLSLLSPSGGGVSTNVSASVGCVSDFSASVSFGVSKPVSAVVSCVSAIDPLPALYESTNPTTAIAACGSSLSATLYQSTKNTSALVDASLSVSASLINSTTRVMCAIESTSTMSAKLPGREYGSPVTAGTGRT